MRRISLTEKLVLFFLLTGVFTLMCVSWFSYSSGKKAILSRTFDQLTAIREIKKQRVENYFDDAWRQLTMIGSSAEMLRLAGRLNQINQGKASPPQDVAPAPLQDSFFEQRLLNSDNILSINILSKGKYYYSLSKDPKQAKLVCHLLDLKSTSYRFAPIISELSNENRMPVGMLSDTVIALALPFSLNDGTEYHLIVELSTVPLLTFMVENNPATGWGLSGESYIVDDRYLMITPSRFLTAATNQTKARTDGVDEALSGHCGTAIIDDYRQIRVLSSYCPLAVKGLHWVILVEIDLSEAMAPVSRLRNEILFLGIFLLLLVFLLALVFARTLSRPVLLLKRATYRIGKGDYNFQVPVYRDDEIGDLTRAFNTMAETIRQQARSRIDGQDSERQRLSMELHDGLGQWLAAARYRLEATDCNSPGKTQSILEETKRMVDDILLEIRRISNNLMPGVLREFGLGPAVISLCRELSYQEIITISPEIQGDLSQVSAERQVYVYRIVQEAINNIVRHSGTREATLSMKTGEGLLTLTIADRGSGFDPALLRGNTGQGIRNMRERTALLGGEMSLETMPGNGTSLIFVIPLIGNNHDQNTPSR